MRIVQISQWYIPRFGYQDHFLAEAWQRMGHEVVTIAPTHVYPRKLFSGIYDSRNPRIVPAGRRIEYDTVVHRLPCLEVREKSILSLQMERLILRLRPSLVLVHGSSNLNPVRLALLKRRMGGSFRLLCDDHALYSVLGRDLLRRTFFRILRGVVNPWVARHVDRFVAVSSETRLIMIEAYGIPAGRIAVIPLGVNTRRFHPDPAAREAVRRELAVADGETLVIYAGKLTPGKGAPALVSALHRLLGTHPAVKAVVVGRGDPAYIRALQQRLEEFARQSRVAWFPHAPHDRLRALYCAADIGLWPAEESITMLEASACGLPVVCSHSITNEERFGQGTGLLFKTPEEMIAHVERLVADPALRRALSDRARETAPRHSTDRDAAAFLELVQPPPAPRRGNAP